jgi:hypothetical protein
MPPMEVTMTEYIIVKKPKKRRFRSEEVPVESMSLVDLLRAKKEEVKALEDFWKEQEKLNKKDDKKDAAKPHQFTFTEGLLLAFMAQYFLGPVINASLKAYGVQ